MEVRIFNVIGAQSFIMNFEGFWKLKALSVGPVASETCGKQEVCRPTCSKRSCLLTVSGKTEMVEPNRQQSVDERLFATSSLKNYGQMLPLRIPAYVSNEYINSESHDYSNLTIYRKS